MDPEGLEKAGRKVRALLAQAKNRRTTMGRMSATGVAYNVAYAAIQEYLRHIEEEARDGRSGVAE
jgi:hypothetical protein